MGKLTIGKEVIARLGNQSVIDNHGLARVAGAGCDTISVHITCPESSYWTQVEGTCTPPSENTTCYEHTCYHCESYDGMCQSGNNYNCLSITVKGTDPCL